MTVHRYDDSTVTVAIGEHRLAFQKFRWATAPMLKETTPTTEHPGVSRIGLAAIEVVFHDHMEVFALGADHASPEV